MYLVSGCFSGMKCRYSGKSDLKEEILKLIKDGKAIPLCPEILGGLATPRVPCEMNFDGEKQRIIGKDGNDYTEEFSLGAKLTLSIIKSLNIKKAILQEKSPSCGVNRIYDGSFSGQLINGAGLTTQLLMENGIEIKSYEEYIHSLEDKEE